MKVTVIVDILIVFIFAWLTNSIADFRRFTQLRLARITGNLTGPHVLIGKYLERPVSRHSVYPFYRRVQAIAASTARGLHERLPVIVSAGFGRTRTTFFLRGVLRRSAVRLLVMCKKSK